MTGDVDDLAGRAQAGDQAAFAALVRRLVRPALAVAWELVPTREDAEDVVQDAFARTWQQLPRYDATRPFAPWFFTIVRNVARNARRRDRRWNAVTLDADVAIDERAVDASPVDALDAMDEVVTASAIAAALDTLSPMQRACFRLTEVEGFDSREAGDMLGVSDATVRVHVHRARHALRALLDAKRRERA